MWTSQFSPTTSPLVGQEITVTSTATDEDGDILTTEWDFDYDGTFEADLTDVPTDDSATHTYNSPGAKTMHVNTPPSAAFSCVPSTATTGQAITCTGVASPDPEGRPVSYAWDSDGDGAFDEGRSDRMERSHPSHPAPRSSGCR